MRNLEKELIEKYYKKELNLREVEKESEKKRLNIDYIYRVIFWN